MQSFNPSIVKHITMEELLLKVQSLIETHPDIQLNELIYRTLIRQYLQSLCDNHDWEPIFHDPLVCLRSYTKEIQQKIIELSQKTRSEMQSQIPAPLSMEWRRKYDEFYNQEEMRLFEKYGIKTKEQSTDTSLHESLTIAQPEEKVNQVQKAPKPIYRQLTKSQGFALFRGFHLGMTQIKDGKETAFRVKDFNMYDKNAFGPVLDFLNSEEKNIYSYPGYYGDSCASRIYVYKEVMQKYDLSQNAIRTFASAIRTGNLNIIQDQFSILNGRQKKGLLTLMIDYYDLGISSSPFGIYGFPTDLAKSYGHPKIEEYLINQQKELGIDEASRNKPTI